MSLRIFLDHAVHSKWFGPVVIGGAALGALFFASKTASAATSDGNTPAPGARATAVTSMMTRTAPALTASLVPQNDAFAGTTVQVLKMGITPTDNSGGEWWQIVTPGGSTGFARAVDPQGVHNFQLEQA